MKKLLKRSAVAAAVVAPLMISGAGFASAATAPTVSATAIPFIGITMVHISGATPGATCGAANQAITAPSLNSVSSLIANPLPAIPNAKKTDASGNADILLMSGSATKVHVACFKPQLLPPSLNFQTAEASVSSPFGS
ncbi:MAG: hypothetical protein LLG14_11215 [Nocardiaceae bacterium]|nr:hypothetical protein [Nocardiaceae bacterium]